MDPATDQVARLVENFGRHVDAYRNGHYNETQVRREFIDPLFVALGWDVHNTAGYAEAYKDVVHEDAIKVGGSTKAPDYCFRIGGARKFFLEAKKPSVSIRQDVAPAYQLRRYAWSAKLPLSILTDFEELAVYDCRVRPRLGDKTGTARVLYLTYDQYVDRWDELAGVFSKQAVLQGSFDKYVAGRKKRGTAEVDQEFLREIETWRDALARNIALRNPQLTSRELNFAVQRTIDRVIFLRICEDRGVESYGRLQALVNGDRVYARLCELFRQADDRYNSGLFHFRSETDRPTAPDSLTPALDVDDKVLKDIFRSLYYPQSPYEFAVLPPDILGNVYEQFLGKVIQLTPAHRAKVEEKPEVKKAGGVYYTPSYIVEYIVSQTVDRLLDGKTPRGVSRLRIVDPACGSGSFLIGAYRRLLSWHRDWYLEDAGGESAAPGKHVGKIHQGAGGQWLLTTDEKKRILLNNIYGVDIDSQAVEVTKLNLLLCVLENENQSTARQLELIHQRVLPDLGENVKCGNSLIGTDFYDGRQMDLFDEEARYQINAFDWETEFPDVFSGRSPGFDAVIGNPPYVRQEQLQAYKDYFKRHYSTYDSKSDLYVYFIERGLSLLAPGGLFGIIVSSGFLRTAFGEGLRRHLQANYAVEGLVNFGGLPVFANAKDTYVCIPIISRAAQPTTVPITAVRELPASEGPSPWAADTYDIDADNLKPSGWALQHPAKARLFEKIRARGRRLEDVLSSGLFSGVKTGLNEAFLVEKEQAEAWIGECPPCREVLRPYVGGQDVRRYHLRESNKTLIAVRSGWTRTQLLSGHATDARSAWKAFRERYGPVAEHLVQYEERAKHRQDQGEYWWELRPCGYYAKFDEPKIIYPDIAKGPRFYLDNDQTYIGNTAYCLDSADKYLLGILNSSLAWFSIGFISIPFGVRAGEYRYRMIYQYMAEFPVCEAAPSNPDDKARHDRMVELVEQMLKLHEQHSAARTDHDRTVLSRQIAAVDKQIDRLVYELYDLTEEEIAVVERD